MNLFDFSLSTVWAPFYGDKISFMQLMSGLDKRSRKVWKENFERYEFVSKRIVPCFINKTVPKIVLHTDFAEPEPYFWVKVYLGHESTKEI